MNKTIFYLAISFLMISCGSRSQTEKTADNSNTPNAPTVDLSKIGRNNYAVIWTWATDNTKLVEDNLVQISEEFITLWKKDIIENAYYDADSKIDKLDKFPNIAFFLKAQSEDEAKAILKDLTVVKKGIANYKLHPVGNLWLDIKKDPVEKQRTSQSFAAVWTTQQSLDKPDADKLLLSQSDAVLELWNKGIIENAYIDIEGTYRINNKTDFVFFVNANSEKEARAICNSLPFYKEDMATYQLHQAGLFWMGRSNPN